MIVVNSISIKENRTYYLSYKNVQMKIINEIILIDELKDMAKEIFGDMIKGVVDIDQEIIAINAELHSDLESLLLENGSLQQNLWGINIYPELVNNNFIEFDSLINIRPSQNNRSRGVENEEIQSKIIEIVNRKIKK